MEIENIEKLIIRNRLEEATIQLKSIFHNMEDEELLNESILILSRLSNFEKKSSQGVIDYLDKEYGKIRLSVINLKSSAKTLLKGKANTSNKNSDERERINHNRILFNEEFKDNKNGWVTKEDEGKECYIKGGRYYFENKRIEAKLWYSTINIKLDTEDNFIIKTRITYLKGENSKAFGLLWGFLDENNLFRFLISADGEFYIDYFIEGEQLTIEGWKKNPIIKTGKKTNLLEIVKNLDVLHFKINQEVVYTMEYISFFGNEFGFGIENNVKIAIDLLRITN